MPGRRQRVFSRVLTDAARRLLPHDCAARHVDFVQFNTACLKSAAVFVSFGEVNCILWRLRVIQYHPQLFVQKILVCLQVRVLR
jgi:hypothetical protein